jgi:hypothetical protein
MHTALPSNSICYLAQWLAIEQGGSSILCCLAAVSCPTSVKQLMKDALSILDVPVVLVGSHTSDVLIP